MKQLSGMDNMFLHLEHGNQYMHVAGLGIYDPATAPGGKVRFKDILAFFEARLDVAPVFRRRLVTVPMNIDRPYWIEEGHVDVEYHVRHIALPHPGDWRQLCIQVARIHSRPLDRSKPLWEAYVIEGLNNIRGIPPGAFAFYIKFHHAAVDGEGGSEVLQAIHSLTADEAVDPDARRTLMRDREPSALELYTRALAHNLQRVPKLANFSVRTARRLAGLGADNLDSLVQMLQEAGVPSFATVKSKIQRPPVTRFSGKVSAHRVVEMVGLPLADIKKVRQKIEGATINDVFMTTVGGALHKYLGAKGELPDRSMTAQVPMTLRGADKGGDAGNQVGIAVMPVHSEIADPLERLRTISDAAGKSKRVTDAVGKELARDLLELLPSIVADPLLRNVQVPRIGLIVSNVRGPDVPLYMAGAQLVNYAPISIAIDGMGLNVTAFSYAGNMWICAVSCREMLPDPAFFADCLRTAFEQMKEAAAREAAFTVAEGAALPPLGEKAGSTIEGRLARKVKARGSAQKKAVRTRKAKAATTVGKRRGRRTATAERKG